MSRKQVKVIGGSLLCAAAILLAASGVLAQPAALPAAPDALAVLPPGPGRDVLIKACSACHSAAMVARQRHDPQGWTDVVSTMVGRGARGTDEELEQVIDYLARSFPEQGASTAVSPPAGVTK
jgi:competence protein ComEA